MSNELVAKDLKKIGANLWDVQREVRQEAVNGDPNKEATVKLVHEYDVASGESTAHLRCNTTTSRRNETPHCESTTVPVEGNMDYDPSVVDDIILELIAAVNERVDLTMMGESDLSADDISGLFKQYWNMAMEEMQVEGFASSVVVVHGSILKVTVTVS